MNAEDYKKQGNVYFSKKEYAEAIECYTTAIIKNPTNPIYYTNRALCSIKTLNYHSAIPDLRKATELDANSTKAHYFLGKSLAETNQELSLSISHLTKAYELGIRQKVSFIEDILASLRKARKRRWDLQEHNRRQEQDDFYRYLTGLIERDRHRQIQQLGEIVGEEADIIRYHADERLSQLECIFSQCGENSKKREIPDHFCGKISFEIMTDPVISKSGITYDRPELIQHFNKIGFFDPITRESLTYSDLIPNLSLKEAIEEWLVHNGWAHDY